jgi:hypothetical protein
MARDSLSASDYVFDEADDLPEWTPRFLRVVLLNLTYDEAHAALLGGVGLFAGIGYRIGYEAVVAAFTVACLLVAFGYVRLRSTAARIMRREAWYFTTVYLVSTVAGWTGSGLF